jgi:hypothetical protein
MTIRLKANTIRTNTMSSGSKFFSRWKPRVRFVFKTLEFSKPMEPVFRKKTLALVRSFFIERDQNNLFF